SSFHYEPRHPGNRFRIDHCISRSERSTDKRDKFSVHGNVAITAHYRMRLERLARYASRPAVSTERLSELPDGRLLYRRKRRWRNGTTEVVFERMDFMATLAALVPTPRAHLTRFHGILAPAAKWRSSIVPSPDEVEVLQTGSLVFRVMQ